MNGQISLFDYINYIENTGNKESSILLEVGQFVYKVHRGEVKNMIVFDEKPWDCGAGNYGYRLKEENGCYGCTWNNEIGKVTFLEEHPARRIAEEYLRSHDVIRAEDICPIKTVAYQYVRDIDNRTMTAFYCELENEMIYIKEFMSYHHIVSNKKKAIKKFMEQQEFKYDRPLEVAYTPVFKNMYRIKQKYDWDYAEANHSYATG